jgi:hypothetical protein
MSAEKIAPALGACGYWMACGPAHDDRKPSLSGGNGPEPFCLADLGELAARRKEKAPAEAEAL